MALNKTRVANSLKGMLVGDALAVRKVTISSCADIVFRNTTIKVLFRSANSHTHYPRFSNQCIGSTRQQS
jgi:hypothetical protein